jgi:hypothetical protein
LNYFGIDMNPERRLKKLNIALILGLILFPIIITSCSPKSQSSKNIQDISNHQVNPLQVLPTMDRTLIAELETMRSPDVPDLPFPDNPDPSLCGIPTQWGSDNQAWLTGVYKGKLIQQEVLLYDSHNRLNITARASHGAEVQILLYQQNPVTDYYLVRIVGAEKPNEGWIPEPFLSFEPVE